MAPFVDILRRLATASTPFAPRVAVAIGAVAVVLLAALVIPVGPPDAGNAGVRDTTLTDSPTQTANAEDLSQFLASRRWGVALQDLMDELAAAAADQAGQDIEMTPELAKIGFLGLMLAPGDNAVLLLLPDGKITRLSRNDKLPDGRTLVSVAGNSLTLAGSDGQQEVLPLFPRARTQTE